MINKFFIFPAFIFLMSSVLLSMHEGLQEEAISPRVSPDSITILTFDQDTGEEQKRFEVLRKLYSLSETIIEQMEYLGEGSPVILFNLSANMWISIEKCLKWLCTNNINTLQSYFISCDPELIIRLWQTASYLDIERLIDQDLRIQ